MMRRCKAFHSLESLTEEAAETRKRRRLSTDGEDEDAENRPPSPCGSASPSSSAFDIGAVLEALEVSTAESFPTIAWDFEDDDD